MNALGVPFQLRRRGQLQPADFLLVETDHASVLLKAVSELVTGDEPSPPRIYAVSTGFLLELPNPCRRARAGAIRLRRAGGHLLIPVDAELSPALLPDEIAALTRDRGLVYLPGGRVLRFDPENPVSAAGLLAPVLIERNGWSPLPSPPARAPRIVEILFEFPDSPDQVFGPAGQEIGIEEPLAGRPAGTADAASKARFGMGMSLARIGKSLNLQGLARLGFGLIQSALEAAPQLGESILGRQESALRDLLRMFREGAIDEALRRALPLGQGNERGAGISGATDLPNHDIRYSLSSLLNTANASAGTSYWFSQIDVRLELEREYRKAAEEAARKGDYRRAAFILARLLNDYRGAAAALLRGGLAHDAAILYLERVNDPVAAAQAFEAAGEFDRALHLYREQQMHLAAAELLRRIGEEDQAIAEFQIAASQLLPQREGHFRAAELLRLKAKRLDLALPYYRDGWAERPSPSSLPCALQLARIFASSGKTDELVTLAREAARFFRSSPVDQAASTRLLNELAQLAETPELETVRDELRDIALMGLTRNLRERAAGDPYPTVLVSVVFGTAQAWRSDFLRDAEFALGHPAAGREQAAPAPPLVSLTRIAQSIVTAVAYAEETEEIFIGFQNGEVHRYSAPEGVCSRVALYTSPVAGLAVDALASFAAVVWKSPSGRIVLASYLRRSDGSFGMAEGRSEGRSRHVCLAQNIPSFPEPHVGLWTDDSLQVLRGASLVRIGQIRPEIQTDDPPRAILLNVSRGLLSSLFLLSNEDWTFAPAPDWAFRSSQESYPSILHSRWTPGIPSRCALAQPLLSWLKPSRHKLEVAGIADNGTAYRTVLEMQDNQTTSSTSVTNISASDLGYRCAALLRPGYLAAVTDRSIHWLRGVSTRFALLSTTEDHGVPDPVACFPCHRTLDLLIVSRDGLVGRVPMSGY